jgi:hypothetical protein
MEVTLIQYSLCKNAKIHHHTIIYSLAFVLIRWVLGFLVAPPV